MAFVPLPASFPSEPVLCAARCRGMWSPCAYPGSLLPKEALKSSSSTGGMTHLFLCCRVYTHIFQSQPALHPCHCLLSCLAKRLSISIAETIVQVTQLTRTNPELDPRASERVLEPDSLASNPVYPLPSSVIMSRKLTSLCLCVLISKVGIMKRLEPVKSGQLRSIMT